MNLPPSANSPAAAPPVGVAHEALFRAVTLAAFGIPTLALILLVNGMVLGYLVPPVIMLCLSTGVYPLLWLLRRDLPFNAVALIFLMLLGGATFALLMRGGLTIAVGAIPLVMITLAGLLYGRTGSLLCLLFALLELAVGAYIFLNVRSPILSLQLWDPHSLLTWVRGAVVLLVFGASIAGAVIYVFERMEAEKLSLQQALQREAEQRLARERAEREREAAQHALAESQRLESLGRLAGGVAHDFNNVLTVILGNTELALSENLLSDETRAYLNGIEKAAQHSVEFTQELLMLSRKDLAEAKVIDLDAFVQRLRSTFNRVIPVDIELRLDVNAAGALVKVAPVNLERALLNLMANARDAIQGKGRITLSTTWRPGGGAASGVAVSVADTGCGLDADTLQRIFEPFFTTKKVGSGTGLGMTLVQSMVIDAGGSIDVQSIQGQGTTVTLLFPAVTDQLISDERPQSTTGALSRDVGKGRVILVVDDQLPVLETITACLQRAGFTVLTCDNGDDAMRMVEDRGVHFDLLCIDGVIPGAATSSVIARLRQVRPGMEVVLCSGYVDEELLLRGIQVGELTCVRKPFHPKELVGTIQRKLDRAA